MKRSEMLELLKERLVLGRLAKASSDFMDNYILDLIEVKGMLPPCNPAVGSGDFEDECGRLHVFECEWDKE